ncbi:helix-turn-helix domain-containing protein [Listeria monocytogenes]|nr:helix-turn-helix domain-containing protein [Listeria monocytogenes]EAF8769711.1 helix-turn-helix domain-containing protein [Listeria monocytogenes]EAK8930001.1 helix-turn-helix domain-containing protein [Listeria monocytogenes]
MILRKVEKIKEKKLVLFKKELSMRQEEFAELLGISRSLIAKIETDN